MCFLKMFIKLLKIKCFKPNFTLCHVHWNQTELGVSLKKQS